MSAILRQLPPANEFALAREFLSVSEHATLMEWGNERFAEGFLVPNENGKHRYFKTYQVGHPDVPAMFWDVRRRAISMFSVTDYEDEPGFHCFLGCNTEGGTVHRHTDPAPPDKYHVRMNIMISKPLSGGDPIIDGKMLEVQERDLWCFFPSVMPHESTPVVGKRKRMVISIGILVPRSLVD